MGLFKNYFYNGNIRLYQVALEAALVDLKIMVGDKLVQVPMFSSSGERSTYITAKPPSYENEFPRATIKLLDIEPDEERQLNINIPFNCGVGKPTRVPTPRIFSYEYTAITKKRSHALQIVEQIISVFSPFAVFRIKDHPNHKNKTDIKVKIQYRPIEDNFSDSEEPVSYTVSILFLVSGNIYSGDGDTSTPVNVIEEVILETNESGSMTQDPLDRWFSVKSQDNEIDINAIEQGVSALEQRVRNTSIIEDEFSKFINEDLPKALERQKGISIESVINIENGVNLIEFNVDHETEVEDFVHYINNDLPDSL
ncbi:hypothetical protein Kuja_1780 [Vibrio phage vB_VchM_Kuja]|uniref:Tail sheath stabilizer and completion protein n=1 Tax=Vibrio phage vB_VchM_Kuja TaxID=2686437 RepID=A0A6B9J5D0_9CAUD|nr:hypothetical protein HWC83_gp057 [Vibrio phage vB_VchM_Kuja]QGZ16170.1 hypothetical protein Kuja_1780 [Vibrio phage vB_VchM_Kuja]